MSEPVHHYGQVQAALQAHHFTGTVMKPDTELVAKALLAVADSIDNLTRAFATLAVSVQTSTVAADALRTLLITQPTEGDEIA